MTTEAHPPKWCVHYRYRDMRRVNYATCGAGVEYSTLEHLPFDRRPCFLTDKGASKPDAAPCAHLRRPTADEMAAYAHRVLSRLNEMSRMFEAIYPWRVQHDGTNYRETVTCPLCGGRLTLVMHTNGHLDGRCATDGCVRWME